MLNFDMNEYCYGCGTCKYVCPKQAIKMINNEDGFIIPKIDESRCIKCGLCEKKCIYLNKVISNSKTDITASSCYMMYFLNDKILESASGGIFYGIAVKAIELGYEVCGCIWDEKQRAIHVVTNDMKTLAKMQGSKYVQSDLQNCYIEIKRKLSQGKKVLFSGTPCQIAGLHSLLGFNENLVTLGLICEGTPSPMVFEKWKKYLEKKYGSNIISVKLRKKGRYGWKSPSTEYKFQNGRKIEQLAFHMDIYMYNFICGLFMRNSCFNCEYKGNGITEDIVVGDCWCADTTDIVANENRGISAAIIRTDKGEKFMEIVKQDFMIKSISVDEVVVKNEPLLRPIKRNPNRNDFFEYLKEHSLMESIKKFGYLKTKKMRLYALLYHMHLFGITKRFFKK